MSGDRLAGLRWLADGDVCRRSRVGCAYMVPGLYMPCMERSSKHLESIAISRYKVAMVVDKIRERIQSAIFTSKVGVQGSVQPGHQIQIPILTDAWNPKKRSHFIHATALDNPRSNTTIFAMPLPNIQIGLPQLALSCVSSQIAILCRTRRYPIPRSKLPATVYLLVHV